MQSGKLVREHLWRSALADPVRRLSDGPSSSGYDCGTAPASRNDRSPATACAD